MPRYRFTGIDANGRTVTGERDAADPDALLAALGNGVRQIQSVQIVDEQPPRPTDTRSKSERALGAGASAGFRRADDVEISGHLAELIESRLPLESGLAAIAAECPSRRMRSTLRGIVDDLAAGNTLESTLAGRRAPAELQALVRAGARSGNTGQILEHYVVNVQSAAELRQILFRGLLYPLLLLALAGAIAITVLLWIVPQFLNIFEGFNIQLPLMTTWLANASALLTEHGGTVAIAGLAIGLVGAVVGRYLLGKASVRRFVSRIPLLGPIARWASLARFSQVLSLLVENEVPLDEALALAGNASGNPEIQDDCRELLAGVTTGESFEAATHRLNRFPPSFVQALTWSQRASGMPEILQSLGDIYASRVRAIIAVLVAIIPPILMLLIGLTALFLIVALFAPMVQLLNSLA